MTTWIDETFESESGGFFENQDDFIEPGFFDEAGGIWTSETLVS